ncbi:MAG: EVE domain-containing protein [Ruminococcus sp.]|nr:EVE domain-containing protein [Ruminococcus sp.]
MENEINVKFTWIDFYTKFANKLLEYRNMRGRLLEKIQAIFKKAELNFPRLEEDYTVTDIDPFTLFSLFNRGQSDENRIKIIQGIIEDFEVASEVPTDFIGVPVVTAKNFCFFDWGNKRGVDDIENLWQFFELALRYADGDNNAKSDFSLLYNQIIKQRKIKWNLCIALFWIRPNFYINLDSKNRKYISNDEAFSHNLTYPELLKDRVPKATDYVDLNNKFLEIFSNENAPFRSFVEFSAFVYQSENNTEKNYWWISTNPEHWSFGSFDVGSSKDFSVISQSGGKNKPSPVFSKVKAGDAVIGYESSPLKNITAIAEIVQESNGKNIVIEKIADVQSGIGLDKLKSYSELANMECFKIAQGCIFKLTREEFDFIVNLINRDELPEPSTELEEEEEGPFYNDETFLSEVYISPESYKSLTSLLKHKKNIIIQGAPGVGKTFAAKRLAYSIIGDRDDSCIEFIQFHQSYTYEDFVMGYKPCNNGYELKNGIFYNFCKKAKESPEKEFFFIIDEINRGNLTKIFGELLMCIEKEYRNTEILLSCNGESFSVPDNLYIIGIMNTADRSLAMVDYVLRRRFSFFSFEPAFDNAEFKKYQNNLDNITFNRLITKIKELNFDIEQDDTLGKGFVIGHSYFTNLTKEERFGKIRCTDENLKEIIDFDIIPTLEEYWFDNQAVLENWKNQFDGVFR